MRRRPIRNPWLSVWLSGANSLLGSARAAWLQEAHRQNEAFMRETQRRVANFWLGHDAPVKRRRKR